MYSMTKTELVQYVTLHLAAWSTMTVVARWCKITLIHQLWIIISDLVTDGIKYLFSVSHYFFKGFHFFHFCKTPYMKCLNEWGKIDLDRGNMFSQSNSLQTHTHTHTHHICNTTPPGPCTSLLIASHTCLTGYLTALSFPITLPTPAERNNYVQLCHWNDNATSSSLYTTRLLTVCGNYLSAASSQSLY